MKDPEKLNRTQVGQPRIIYCTENFNFLKY